MKFTLTQCVTPLFVTLIFVIFLYMLLYIYEFNYIKDRPLFKVPCQLKWTLFVAKGVGQVFSKRVEFYGDEECSRLINGSTFNFTVALVVRKIS